MTKVKIEFEVEIPEGYEWTGEIRKPLKGDYALANWNGVGGEPYVHVAGNDFVRDMHPILRKVELWKPLTPEKALEFMLSRKEVTLRHYCWKGTGRTHKNTLNRISHNGHTLCVQLEVEAFISNVEYLEPDA
jgi:hypothetical protein